MKKLNRLKHCEDGTTLVEFGLIAPALIVMLMGSFDAGHGMYVRAVLNGALQEAGRASSLEGAYRTSNTQSIDAKVEEIVREVAPGAEVKPVRRYYKTFSEAAAAEAEEWTDNDPDGAGPLLPNGICDDNESYLDENSNDTWDADGGSEGTGDSKDVVILTVTIKYQRLFPVHRLLGLSDEVTVISDTILANQPYGAQQQYQTPTVKNCT
jgi:Flp pilus assembly pilin Flp